MIVIKPHIVLPNEILVVIKSHIVLPNEILVVIKPHIVLPNEILIVIKVLCGDPCIPFEGIVHRQAIKNNQLLIKNISKPS